MDALFPLCLSSADTPAPGLPGLSVNCLVHYCPPLPGCSPKDVSQTQFLSLSLCLYLSVSISQLYFPREGSVLRSLSPRAHKIAARVF